MRSLFRGLSRLMLAALGVVGILASSGAAPASHAQAPTNQDEQAQSTEPTIRENVDLVNIYFSVRAKKGGQLIPNLEKSEFKLQENGKQQTIRYFARDTDLPLTIGLLIDISASQENLIDVEKDAASAFFTNVIRKKDEAFLISFGKSTDLLQDYTSSPRLLRTGLQDLKGDGNAPMIGRGPIPNVNTGPVPSMGTPKGTLLYDAVYLASDEKLKSEVGRKALILITDGEDQGSHYKLNEAIEAAQKADAIIYSIFYVDRGFYSQGGYVMLGGGGESELRKMSEDTGGHVFTVGGKHTLQDVFKEIQDEMRNQYAIGYVPTNSDRDGSFRKIQIKTDKQYKVQARSGYYATPNDAR